MSNQEPLLYSMKAAVAVCGGAISRTAIYNAAREGKLTLRKAGKRTFVLRTDLMAWLLAQETSTGIDKNSDAGKKRLEHLKNARAARNKIVTDEMVERGWKTCPSQKIPKWRVREILEAGLGMTGVPQWRKPLTAPEEQAASDE